jgi:hypothetical protein
MAPDSARRGRLGTVGLLTVTAGVDRLRLDAEFAERQMLVGMEDDTGRRGQDQLLATGVLQQVGAEIVCDLILDALVALAILGREPH